MPDRDSPAASSDEKVAEAIDKLWRVRYRLVYANPGWPSEVRLIDEALEALAEVRNVVA